MAWIESHQKLAKEPKLFDLMVVMSWDKAQAIGKLHLLWWWCVDHAEDGDLRRYTDAHIALAVEIDRALGKQFVDAMVNAGFLERKPYFRIHNWWKYVRRFMQQRYKDDPSKWKRIEAFYSTGTVTGTVADTVTGTATQETNQPTNLTNLTNQHPPGAREFASLWGQYPNKDGKKAAERSFKASVKTDDDWKNIQLALGNYLKADTVKRGYIKNGSTWFANWKDWIDYRGVMSFTPPPQKPKKPDPLPEELVDPDVVSALVKSLSAKRFAQP